ncbi:hypothetical protein RHMOL_Rhmol02G0042000 [Rhododendron molle]|uniref:Uncharacterized protein n=1 Tax=Rhododendron molle TaxID=49168 RepID=A0ACC0PMZ1_RHOML|nr:hypothetical protein RHMOL_Rhmol02G0042000 [Rhododendron molle]
MHLKDAAKHLNVSQPEQKATCWDYGIHRWPPRKKNKLIHQSYQNETPMIVGQEGISQLNSDTLPSDQPLAVTIDTNSGVVMEIHPPQFSPKARQENPDDNFGNYEVEAVGMGVEGTREGEMEEGQLNSRCLGKGKSKVGTPRGDRVKIPIPLEDILQAGGLHLNDAAKKFKAGHLPMETSILVDLAIRNLLLLLIKREFNSLNCDILPSDHTLAANVDTNSVVLKARWVDDIIVKIRLPKPWKMAELEQQVKKRLKLESGTYYIRYKDEQNELITILCDEDLQEYISSSRPLDTSSIEVFLVPK